MPLAQEPEGSEGLAYVDTWQRAGAKAIAWKRVGAAAGTARRPG